MWPDRADAAIRNELQGHRVAELERRDAGLTEHDVQPARRPRRASECSRCCRGTDRAARSLPERTRRRGRPRHRCAHARAGAARRSSPPRADPRHRRPPSRLIADARLSELNRSSGSSSAYSRRTAHGPGRPAAHAPRVLPHTRAARPAASARRASYRTRAPRVLRDTRAARPAAHARRASCGTRAPAPVTDPAGRGWPASVRPVERPDRSRGRRKRARS
jgi:hypothetical protein